jgi:hypothetical protein
MNGQRHQDEQEPDERHPDAAALAEYQAGLAGGRRGRRLAAHVANCARCASVSEQLAAVSSALASAPVPPLPEAVESRITAALAAEAGRTAEAATTAETMPAETVPAETVPAETMPAEGSSTEGPATTEEPHHTAPKQLSGLSSSQRTRGNTGPRRSRGDASGPPRRARGGRRLRPAVLASGVAAACLVVFGAVFGLVHLSSGPSSSSAASSSHSSPVSGPNVAAPAAEPAGGHAAGSAEKATFTVTNSGTQYEPATLAAQVRTKLAAKSTGTPSPAGLRLATTSPSAQLAGCVLHLTGQVRPSLVDSATYQGKPAYVIAVPDHVWVVGPECTASDSHLIASIVL